MKGDLNKQGGYEAKWAGLPSKPVQPGGSAAEKVDDRSKKLDERLKWMRSKKRTVSYDRSWTTDRRSGRSTEEVYDYDTTGREAK